MERIPGECSGIFSIVFLHKEGLETKTPLCILHCVKFKMLNKVEPKAVNLGVGDGMQFSCRLKLEGDRHFETL